jgi:hypothetical protein
MQKAHVRSLGRVVGKPERCPVCGDYARGTANTRQTILTSYYCCIPSNVSCCEQTGKSIPDRVCVVSTPDAPGSQVGTQTVHNAERSA